MRHHEALGSLRKYVGDCNKNGKRAAGFDWQKSNFARASRIFLHVFVVDARLQSETSYFHALWRTWTQLDNNFLFLKFDTVLQNSTPEKFDKVWSSANSLFKWHYFCSRLRRCCLFNKLPNFYPFFLSFVKKHQIS